MDGTLDQAQHNLELRDYLRVLRRQWVLIVLVTGLVTALGLGYSLTRTPIYEATSRVVLDEGYSRTILFADETGTAIDLDQQVVTETDIMKSNEAQNLIEERLGYEPDVRIVNEQADNNDSPTRAISVIATDSDRDAAVEEAEDFAQTYTTVRRVLIQDDIEATIEETQAELESLDARTARDQARIRALDQLIPITASPSEKERLEAERRRLAFRVADDSVAERQGAIDDRLALLRTALEANENRGIFKRIVAVPPDSPISPQPVRDGLIAFLLGLSLGIMAAYLRDYYDETLRTKDDLDHFTGGLPVLGIVPAIKTWRDRKAALLETVTHPRSPASEAYRSVRTSLEFAGVGQTMSSVLVTSSVAGEGKSTTAANLAVTLASAGKDVVLVDCDLRRPRAHEFFGLDNSVGFTTVLLGASSLDTAAVRAPGVPGLRVLPSGPRPPNPSELLDTAAASMLLELLAESADHVVIDSPPLIPVSDAAILGGYADATVLVVQARSTKRRALRRSLEILDQTSAPLTGIVLNAVGSDATYGYSYDYNETYAADEIDLSAEFLSRGREAVAMTGPGPDDPAPDAPDAPASPVPPTDPVSPNGNGVRPTAGAGRQGGDDGRPDETAADEAPGVEDPVDDAQAADTGDEPSRRGGGGLRRHRRR